MVFSSGTLLTNRYLSLGYAARFVFYHPVAWLLTLAEFGKSSHLVSFRAIKLGIALAERRSWSF